MIKILPILFLLSTTPYDMATKKYRPAPSQQIISTAGQFSPAQIGSEAGALQNEFNRQDRQRSIEAEQRKANDAQRLDNLKAKSLNAQQASGELVALANLSSTLTQNLMGMQMEENERARQRGIRKKYEEGVPAEEQKAFDDDYERLRDLDQQGQKAAIEAANNGLDAPSVRQITKLSGWEAVGYAEATIKQAAYDWPAFFQENKKNVTIMGEEGKPVTYDTARTEGDRAEIMATVRNQYLDKYKDFRPELLNKFLFEPMKQYEVSLTAQWYRDQEAMFKQEEKDKDTQNIIAAVQQGDGEAFVQSFLNDREAFYGGPRKAREFAQQVLKDAIDGKLIDANQVDALLDHTFENRNGKEVRIRDQFPDLAALSTYALTDAHRRSEEYKVREQIKINDFDAEVAAARQQYANEGRKMPEDIKEQLIKKAKDLGIHITQSSQLSKIVTQEDVDDDELEAQLIQQMRNPETMGPITMEQVSQFNDFEKYQQYAKLVPDNLAEYKDEVDYGYERVESQVRTAFDLSGADGSVKDDERAVIALHLGKSIFRQAFEENLKSMDARTARNEALKTTSELLTLKDGDNLDKLPILAVNAKDTMSNYQIIESRNALEDYQEDPTVIEGKLEGTQRTADKLAADIASGNGFTIPETYRVLAANSNGKYNKWQIADMQLKAYGHPGLVKPPVEVAVEEQPLAVQRLLNSPSPSRTHRAMYGGNGYLVAGPAVANGQITDNWTKFLDLVASVESKAHGGYDAMNVPYTNDPYNSRDYLTRPLSDMTIGEVIQLQKDGVVHAAGRYQFTNHQGTLSETILEAGLSPDDKFSPENQDRLAIARARWRMKTFRNQGLSALRNEWVGLENVSNQVLRDAYNGIVNTSSPYNSPENLNPALARKVYTTGNIGPTSTGPHLDVKRTDGSYFEYGDLDQYVEVQDKELGRVPLSKVPETGDFASHTRRGSHGRDYGTFSGSDIFLKNGAKVVSRTTTEHGDKLVIRLPDGREFSFLHGKAK